MGVTTFTNLYMVRVLLLELGVKDYGLFNLIAGILAMMLFLNGAMTTSSQRYLSFFNHSSFENKVRIFSTIKWLHAMLGFFVLTCLIFAVVPVFEHMIKVPEYRYEQAYQLYLIMTFGVVASIVTVPYNAQLNAYEHLGIDALFGILESLLKLLSAFCIVLFAEKLLALGILFVSVSILMLIMKITYCRVRYLECRVFVFQFDRTLYKEMMGFTGWNTFGAICGVARVQGLAIVLNNFFGVYVNAVYAIAVQINGKLREFSVNVLKAINPKIIKYESSGVRHEMLNYSMHASRFSLLLYSAVALPLYFELEFLLSFWLGDYPQESVIFIRLFLILSFINLTTIGLQTAIQAIGDVKFYQVSIGSLLLLTIPFSIMALQLGYPPHYVLVVSIILESISCVMRLLILKNKAGLDIRRYLTEVVYRAMIVILSSSTLLQLVTFYYEISLYRAALSFVVSTLSMIVLSYRVALNASERDFIKLKGLRI